VNERIAGIDLFVGSTDVKNVRADLVGVKSMAATKRRKKIAEGSKVTHAAALIV
jgi:hypothetical protein